MPRPIRSKQLPENLSTDLVTAQAQVAAQPPLPPLTCPTRGKKRGQKAKVISVEARARLSAGGKKSAAIRKERQSHLGIPPGQSRATITALRDMAHTEAERITEHMTKELGVDDDYAKAALTYCVGLLKLDKAEATGNRLIAAKTILDFTKQKPAAKTDLTINKAEDFLKQIIASEETSPDKPRTD